MKKLFAIIAAVSAAMAMGVILASCGGTETGYEAFGVYEPKQTPTPQPDPKPTPEPQDEAPVDTTMVRPGYWGTVINKSVKLLSFEAPDGKVETVIKIQNQDGEDIAVKDTLNFTFHWNDVVYESSDTLTVSERIEFIPIKDITSNWSDTINNISTQVAEKQFELRASTFAQILSYKGESSKLLINGKWELFLSPLDYIREGQHSFGAEVEEIEDGEKLIERELNIVRASLALSNVDIIEAEGKAYVDREISKEPEVEVEPEPEPDPVQTEPEPDPDPEPTPEPAEQEPAIKIDFEIQGLQSFIAWTSVMDGNDKFHDCLLFDCGERWAALLDQSTVIYFSKNMFAGTEYNSLNYDLTDGCWVPALASTTNDHWVYSTILRSGAEIKRSCEANKACIEANKAFQKNDNAVTSWKVDAQAETTEINGKKAIVITSHRVVINKDFRIIFCES